MACWLHLCEVLAISSMQGRGPGSIQTSARCLRSTCSFPDPKDRFSDISFDLDNNFGVLRARCSKGNGAVSHHEHQALLLTSASPDASLQTWNRNALVMCAASPSCPRLCVLIESAQHWRSGHRSLCQEYIRVMKQSLPPTLKGQWLSQSSVQMCSFGV